MLPGEALPMSYSEGWKLPPGQPGLMLRSVSRGICGPQLSSPNPTELVLWLFTQPMAQFHAFHSEGLCTVCPRGHGDGVLRHASCPGGVLPSSPPPMCKDRKFHQETSEHHSRAVLETVHS